MAHTCYLGHGCALMTVATLLFMLLPTLGVCKAPTHDGSEHQQRARQECPAAATAAPAAPEGIPVTKVQSTPPTPPACEATCTYASTNVPHANHNRLYLHFGAVICRTGMRQRRLGCMLNHANAGRPGSENTQRKPLMLIGLTSPLGQGTLQLALLSPGSGVARTQCCASRLSSNARCLLRRRRRCVLC